MAHHTFTEHPLNVKAEANHRMNNNITASRSNISINDSITIYKVISTFHNITFIQAYRGNAALKIV